MCAALCGALLVALFALPVAMPPAGASVVVVPVQAPNPKRVVPLGSLASKACEQHPSGKVCENEVVSLLDGARAASRLKPYALPANFTALRPDAQLLVLANLDRIIFNEAPVAGVSPILDRWSASALSTPHLTPPAALAAQKVAGYATDAANGAFPNVLAAYFVWMYDDGPGGPSPTCPKAGAKGCWSHRQAILAPSGLTPTAFGAAVQQSGGQLQVEAIIAEARHLTGVKLQPSWTALTHRGAGTNHYKLGALPVLPAIPARLHAVAGSGTVSLSWHENRVAKPLTSFVVVYHRAGSSTLSYSELLPSVESYTAYSLTPGETYDFSVIATDADGTSLPATIAETAS